jgi:aminopeptidase N
MRARADAVREFEAAGPRAIYAPGAGPGEYETLLTEMNYEKGAWVLHMLRRLVGDAAFFQGVRDYYAALRDRTAWTADFARIMEAASGRSLERHFDQWVARPGMPTLAASIVGEGRERRLRIEQLQGGPPYALAVDVELRWDGGSERRVVEMDASRAEIPLGLEGPVRVVLDPDGWLLFVDRSLPID